MTVFNELQRNTDVEISYTGYRLEELHDSLDNENQKIEVLEIAERILTSVTDLQMDLNFMENKQRTEWEG